MLMYTARVSVTSFITICSLPVHFMEKNTCISHVKARFACADLNFGSHQNYMGQPVANSFKKYVF